MAAKDSRHIGPEHVAIIMDGNGRWATRRGLPRLRGHKVGATRVREIVRACPDQGVRYLTLFAFSTENWRRARTEVAGLMALFRSHLRSEADELTSSGVRVRFIGERSALNRRLQDLMSALEHRTRENDRLHLTIALNYGARDEIARAAARIAAAVARGEMAVGDVSAATIGRNLETADLPDPDLVIRTSGETRISNFLLWQSAYAEYEFTPVLWPDFSADHMADILLEFGGRERRFGAVLT
ncbi:di-trans,poly-cis-decaprenylcistransferase [Meridianimarinicoccus roseus]|jgi:undecaprenyl diphosphate synthase|uniref:Isoprenyl transferase n=1 Tax=Meridianimarinicoccus roseus TaxID=2072018 RepID=A0A2V2LH50_9RHOB|nr:polyprenyl diphosphate synthase [Meridianimarinicoccus roseus]PWR03311.1 di-trans,poly-cis-decaprenylcistransferase [Meridianimarinicoccus roseus]